MSQGLAEAFGSPLQASDLLLRDYNRNQPLTVEPMPLPNQGDKTELTPLQQAFASPPPPPQPSPSPQSEVMSGLGAYYNQLGGPTTLEEAFANPPPPEPTSLEEAFASPLTPEVNNVMEIEGENYELPTQFFTLSEEEQAKMIEALTKQIKANNKKKQKVAEIEGDAIDIDAITQSADQGIQTYGDVTGNMVLDSASSVPGAYMADRALNALQSVGTKVPPAARLLGPLGASMATAPEAKDFLTGQGGYDPNKHGISLEPILPVDVGRIPYHFNRAVFGTHDPIGSAINYFKDE